MQIPPESQQTPMIKQYLEIKKDYTDCVLFFRLGDFYEMFFSDAVKISKELSLTLTGRGKDENRIPMCGIPYHAAENYVSKLIAKGYKVAICEQTEDATQGKSITKREVVKVVTPATHLSDDILIDQDNHYLAALYKNNDESIALSFVDSSTGEFKCCVFESLDLALDTLTRLNPKECLIEYEKDITLTINCLVSTYNPLPVKRAIEKFCSFFKIQSIASFGLDSHDTTIVTAWAIIEYLERTQKNSCEQLNSPKLYQLSDAMILDPQSIRNLELFNSIYDNEKKGSLFWVLNKTKTAMGARLLKQWLLHPLTKKEDILHRYDALDSLKADILSREEIREVLNQVYDLERLLTRIVAKTNNPRDILALKESLQSCLQLGAILTHFDDPLLKEASHFFNKSDTQQHPFNTLIKLINSALIDPAPVVISQGNVIKDNYNAELDELKQSFKDIKDWIGSLEAKEQARTGIKTLRVGFNKVFGYYFQVSNGQTAAVPDDYIRKQTLTNAERYITPELKEKETILLNGEEKQTQLENEIYSELISLISDYIKPIQECAKLIARIDCLQSFATIAQQKNYCRPSLTENSAELYLSHSRHPVLEHQDPSSIIANTVSFTQDSQILLITGPNMAGKSTLMKQVALAVIMAQSGCFVAAETATIGLVDRCFTRIGASDNLASGQSTFMVEMVETATILHNASKRSLILLDEIGRGTSTYDGMSIAGAVVQFIHDSIGARTLFATHYHELTSIETTCNSLKNVSMEIQEDNQKLAFTYKLINGPADKSYGIHVAQMAGLPERVVSHAKTLLQGYESVNHHPAQMSLFT
jgi:DNA mismatch repair protein MutS